MTERELNLGTGVAMAQVFFFFFSCAGYVFVPQRLGHESPKFLPCSQDMPKLNFQEVALFGLMVVITPFPRWGSLRPQGDEAHSFKKPGHDGVCV